MKKALAILLLISYTLCAFGVSINFHHCGGHLKYVTLKEDHKKKCCKKKVMPPGCCKDSQVKFKKSGNDFLAKQIELSFQIVFSADLPALSAVPINTKIVFKAVEQNIHNNSPPDIYSPPLYILNEVFLI